MTTRELKKILLISSVSIVAAFGLSACGGEEDKAKAPAAAMEKSTSDASSEAATTMDAAKDKAEEVVEEVKEKAGEMVDEAKVKAEEAAAKAKQDAIDAAKEKAEEELKKRMPE